MKYAKILNDTWEYLENNFKGSEITIDMWVDLVEKECDNDYCFKQCVKMLWEQWEWFDLEEEQYTKNYIKEKYNIKVV
jgi:hypothetical protein